MTKEYPDPRAEKDGAGHAKLQARDIYYTGKVIIEEGSFGHRAYYIESGRVEVSVKEGGHKVVISELGPGEIFGEMSLIAHEPRTATVTAIENTTVTIISETELLQRLKGLDDKAIQSLIFVLIERLKNANLGQMRHYRNLMEFQNRVLGILEVMEKGIDPKRRKELKAEIEPLLENIERVLEKYVRKPEKQGSHK